MGYFVWSGFRHWNADLLGVVFAGAETSAMYIRVLGNPWINFGTEMMPNLHGLAGSFQAGSVFELGMSGVVVLAFLWTCFRTDDYELLFALSILCGLLISFHSGIGDDVLLLLVFVLIAAAQVDKPLRIIMALCLTPLPYFTGLSISVTLPLLFLLTVVFAVVSVENGHRRSLAAASATP